MPSLAALAIDLIAAMLNPLLWGIMLAAVVVCRRFWLMLVCAFGYALCTGVVGFKADLKTAIEGVFGAEARYLLIRFAAAALVGSIFWWVKRARIARTTPAAPPS